MAAEKRPASNVFGTSQMVVKRQKSDANLGGGSTVALSHGGKGTGAMIQAVSLSCSRIKSGFAVNMLKDIEDFQANGLRA